MAKITACSTLVYTTATLADALERIAGRGFSRVEIAHMGNYCTHYPPEQKPSEVKELLDRYSLTPIAINYFPGHIVGQDMSRSPFTSATNLQRYKEHMRTFLTEMHELEIPLALSLAGRRTEESDRDQHVAAAAAVLNELAEYARKLGIKLALEVPHCYSICNTLQRARDMLDRIESDNVVTILDCSHQQVIGYQVREYLDVLGDRLGHVHLRDAAGEDTADFRQNLELTPGKGEVDFRCLAQELDRFGYHNEVTLELEYQGRPLQEIEPEVDAAIRHLQQCGWEFPETVPAE